MFTGEFDYTVSSTDEEHYNRINCCLAAPITKYCSMTVTSLTTNCNIVVLDKTDYIMINGKQYCLEEDFTKLNIDSYAGLMNRFFQTNGIDIDFSIDNASRLTITSSERFVIERATYNVQLLTGLYNTNFPIYSDYDGTKHYVLAKSVGFCLSTPILYLISNVGTQSYRNDIKNDTNMTGSKIVMRLNNSFSADCPIIINNADFSTTILSNDLSNIQFTLCDGFMKEVKLLSPMYLAIHVSAIKDDDVMSDIQLMLTNQQK